MSTHICNSCRNIVDDSYAYCPHCGSRQLPPDSGPKAWSNFSQSFMLNDAFAESPEGISRGVTALLAIFLGFVGGQYFYIHKIYGGLLACGITLISVGTIPALFGIAQGIYMLTLSNSEFYNKYVASRSSIPMF